MEFEVKLSSADISRLNNNKRRQVNLTQQKDVLLKKLRAQGQEYPDRKLGETLMTPAVPSPPAYQVCHCKNEGCALPGPIKINLFNQFRAHDNQIQGMILMNCLEITLPKGRSMPAAQSAKEYTYKYHVLVNGVRHELCRQSLLTLFGVSRGRLEHVIAEMRAGKLVPEDKRGKQDNRLNKVNDLVRDEIRHHIGGYDTYKSHYCRPRAPAGTRYLSPDLNATLMYEDFLQQQRNNGKLECEQWVYQDVFNREFPLLKLCTPKTDTCDECDRFKALLYDATAQERVEIQHQQLMHHTHCEQAYEAHKGDCTRAQTDPNYVVLTVDLEQVMFTPGMRNSSSFYLRKMSNYNLAIHLASDGNAIMHLWTELVGSRGSNEIASCVWDYVKSNFNQAGAGGIKTLVVWMDRCIGQNNIRILLSLIKRIVDVGYFAQAEQKFFHTGHSYNSCDRDFGLIELKIRQLQLQVPTQIEDLIRSACSENSFEPKRMDLCDFLDFKTRSKQLKFPTNFRVTPHMWYTVSSAVPDKVRAWRAHDVNENWIEHKVKYNRQTHSVDQVPAVRVVTIPVEKSKLRDLEKILPQLHSEGKAYYWALIEEEKERDLVNPTHLGNKDDESDDPDDD